MQSGIISKLTTHLQTPWSLERKNASFHCKFWEQNRSFGQRREQVIMSASSGRTSSKAKKLWNSSQLQKAPTCGKCFNNHIPKVAVWAGVASAPLPHPFFQWVQWGKREARKGQCAQPVSPSPAAHPQEGTYDTQTRRKKWWRPRKHSCNSPYLTYKEAFNKIPKVS